MPETVGAASRAGPISVPGPVPMSSTDVPLPTPARSKRAVVAPPVSDSNPVAYVGAHRSHASTVWAIRSFGLFGGQGHGGSSSVRETDDEGRRLRVGCVASEAPSGGRSIG